MEKEDILAESRKENKGQDPQEKPVIDRGMAIGSAVAFCLLSMVYGCYAAKVKDYTVGSGLYGAFASFEFAVFLYKYFRLKRTHELLLAIFFGVCTIALLACFFVVLYR